MLCRLNNSTGKPKGRILAESDNPALCHAYIKNAAKEGSCPPNRCVTQNLAELAKTRVVTGFSTPPTLGGVGGVWRS